MSFDWARLLSKDLIQRNGTPVVLRLVGDPEFSRPSRGGESEITEIDTHAVFLRKVVDRSGASNGSFELATDLSSGDVQVYISAQRDPTPMSALTAIPMINPGDLLKVGEDTYGIGDVETIGPDLTNVCYVLKVRF